MEDDRILTELKQITQDLFSQPDCVETIIKDTNCKFNPTVSIELASITLGKKLIKTMLFDCNCNKHHNLCTLKSKSEENFTYEIINL
jgi:hypothetical protein